MRLGRALGNGALKKVTRGRERALWVLDFVDGSGVRHRQALSPDKRIAERMRADLIAKRDLQLAGLGSQEGQSRPLKEVRDAYLADLGTRTSKRHSHYVGTRLDRILAGLRVVRVRDLLPYAVLTYRAQRLKDGLSNRSANLEVDALSSALRWAERSRLIAENPIEHLARLREDQAHQRRRRRALSDDEIWRLLKAAGDEDAELASWRAADTTITHGTKGDDYGGRDRRGRIPQRPLISALIATGARWGELRRVRWSDVDLDERSLTLRATVTKTGTLRVIPLRAELVDELLELRRVQEQVLGQAHALVFLSPDGTPWKDANGNALRLLNRLLERAGIVKTNEVGETVDVHSLRTTAGSRMARSGVSLALTQRLLGHSSPVLTAKHYLRLELEDLREAVEMAGGKGPRLVRTEDEEAIS